MKLDMVKLLNYKILINNFKFKFKYVKIINDFI